MLTGADSTIKHVSRSSSLPTMQPWEVRSYMNVKRPVQSVLSSSFLIIMDTPVCSLNTSCCQELGWVQGELVLLQSRRRKNMVKVLCSTFRSKFDVWYLYLNATFHMLCDIRVYFKKHVALPCAGKVQSSKERGNAHVEVRKVMTGSQEEKLTAWHDTVAESFWLWAFQHERGTLSR